ncbi:3-mercaptopyruvate sulfurtransferase-like [Saccoglossus kowalevskii]|uniref:Sulfurtransferase n=1 Tax=Saccoglossus kowalevskii TaxID=10224 RepID=A0ABM0GUV6_SACKO|nr:PREDICTED: 3-mercaptopyruvate sulfurtransferase-like [Saccoglossus kowalevskii]
MSKMSPMVGIKWLAEKLSSGATKNFRVLDSSWHLPNTNRIAAQEYPKKHIRGALFFDIDVCSDTTSKYVHMLPSAELFANYVGNLGINNDTHVVVYDNNDNFGLFSAPRVWWMFRHFGHPHVSILDGGLPKWINEGHPVTDEIPTVEPAKFVATANSTEVVSFEEMVQNVTDGGFQVMDARAAGRFDGVDPEPRPDIKPGHIPKSISFPFPLILDGDTREVKSLEDIRKIFDEKNISLDKPLTASCGSGVSACCLILAANLCGKDDVRLFDGAWVEYYLRADPKDIHVKGQV